MMTVRSRSTADSPSTRRYVSWYVSNTENSRKGVPPKRTLIIGWERTPLKKEVGQYQKRLLVVEFIFNIFAEFTVTTQRTWFTIMERFANHNALAICISVLFGRDWYKRAKINRREDRRLTALGASTIKISLDRSYILVNFCFYGENTSPSERDRGGSRELY